MGLVRLLPPELADKIAAGEVVERPASVVKELAENSLDAGAGLIKVAVEGGGLKAIRVMDDGSGMEPEDALLALKRHATSKIADQADLFRVTTMGFRGEALPAIASVSRLRLTTRPAKAPAAFRVETEGGLIREQEETGAPPGTEILVRDLFYNTPARLKFVKTARTETAWIKEALVRLALAWPGVGFELIEGDRAGLKLDPVTGREERLADVFGRETSQGLIRIEADHPAAKVQGWISPAQESRATGRTIYLYVNGRYIREKTVLSGLLAGYEGRLERGRYPLAALFLEVEPGTVDVNVHPAKLEVRFHHARAIRQAVVGAVSQALRKQERFMWTGTSPSQGPAGLAVAERGGGYGPPDPSPPWSKAGRNRGPAWGGGDPGFGPKPSAGGWRSFKPSHEEPGAWPPPPPEPDQPLFSHLGTLGGLYLVGQVGADLVLIDQHAAHERIIYDRLMDRPLQGQPLLVPEKVVLPPAQAELLAGLLEEAGRLGLEVEPFGPEGRTFVVKSLPALLTGSDPARLVHDLLDELSPDPGRPSLERLALALAGLACRTALKAGRELKPEEVEALVNDLGRLQGPLVCPHGRPIIKRLPRSQIDRWFGRA